MMFVFISQEFDHVQGRYRRKRDCLSGRIEGLDQSHRSIVEGKGKRRLFPDIRQLVGRSVGL